MLWRRLLFHPFPTPALIPPQTDCLTLMSTNTNGLGDRNYFFPTIFVYFRAINISLSLSLSIVFVRASSRLVYTRLTLLRVCISVFVLYKSYNTVTTAQLHRRKEKLDHFRMGSEKEKLGKGKRKLNNN